MPIVKNKEGRYELENGGFLSSPSRILRPLTIDKYKDIPNWQLEKAADFGKEIHEAIEIYHRLDQDYEEVKQLLYTTKHINTFNQYLNWLKEHNVKVLEVEKLVWSEKQKYYGYIDLLCEIDGIITIVDLKTRSNLYSDDDFFVERLQTYMYGIAYSEMNKKPVKVTFLVINKNTKNQKKYIDFELTSDEKSILATLIILEEMLNKRKLGIN